MGKLLLQPVLQLLEFCLLASNAPPPSLLANFTPAPFSKFPTLPPCSMPPLLPLPPAAYVYSLISIVYSRVQAEFESHGLFFETSSLLITFVCLGVLLQCPVACLAVQRLPLQGLCLSAAAGTATAPGRSQIGCAAAASI